MAKLDEAIEAIKAGDKVKGKQLLAEVLKEDRKNEQAWLWLTQTDITHEEKIKSLRNVLKINPFHEEALRQLNFLQSANPSFNMEPSPKVPPRRPSKLGRFSQILILSFAGLSLLAIIGFCAITFTPSKRSESTPQPATTKYVCGIDRCRDSGLYGDLDFPDGINIWNNPDPNRGGVHHKASHGDQVLITSERRVSEGPGGLWYRLQDGGWTNDLWLTDQICTPENLPQYSFANCIEGEY